MIEGIELNVSVPYSESLQDTFSFKQFYFRPSDACNVVTVTSHRSSRLTVTFKKNFKEKEIQRERKGESITHFISFFFFLTKSSPDSSEFFPYRAIQISMSPSPARSSTAPGTRTSLRTKLDRTSSRCVRIRTAGIVATCTSSLCSRTMRHVLMFGGHRGAALSPCHLRHWNILLLP